MGKYFRPELERFFEKVTVENECWLWQGSVTGWGYGQFRDSSGKRVYVHKFIYEKFCGAVPNKCQVDHLCRNKTCVNPAHLEAVTKSENSRRNLKHFWKNIHESREHQSKTP